MATRAESLIRQFCQQRRVEVQAAYKVTVEALPLKVSIASLAPRVRRSIRVYRDLNQRAQTIKAALMKEGYSSYELDRKTSTITNPDRERATSHASQRQIKRLAQIEAVQQTAYVTVMGRTPAEARIVVEELVKALKKI